MKITYEFVTGEKVVIDVPDEVGAIVQLSRKAEHANNERHRYHSAFSLNNMAYEGMICNSPNCNPADTLIRKERAEECEKKLLQLTPTQRRRYEMRYGDDMSVSDIARAEHAKFNSVKESLQSAQKKLDKNK